MTQTDHPFDPGLQPVFAAAAHTAPVKLPDSRDLFFALVHSGEHPEFFPHAYGYLQSQLQAIGQNQAAFFSDGYAPEKVAQLHGKTFASAIRSYEDLAHFTPVLQTELHWLHAVNQAATCQTPIASSLMAVYLKITGQASYLPFYEGIVQLSGLHIPALHSRMFIKQSQFGNELFDFASTQLAFSVHCRTFFPEMLGFTLACCKSSLFSYLGSNEQIIQLLDKRQNLLYGQLPALADIIQHYAGSFPEQADAIWRRIQHGFYLYQHHMQCCQLPEHRPVLTTPQQQVIALLQMLAPKAAGHHGTISIADKKLDDWFSEVPFDSEGFLSALRHSSYIDQATPERSPLLRLFDFGGPMFGVLNQPQKELLRNWVLLENDPFGLATTEAPAPVEPIPSVVDCKDTTDYNALSHRQLFYYLVNADLYPAVLTRARQHVHSVLWRAQYLNRLPFKNYSHEAFSDHIQGIYQAEVDSYEPLQDKPRLSKNAYLWGIEQFAPAILTDGCWLQHCKQLKLLTNGTIADLLFKIYDDETGNGILAQNHPVIYQELLNNLAIQVPPVNSRSFCDSTQFIGSAFDIPVYLMAISKFPSAFLPELLGLNLAIEISGLGKVYLRLAQELRFHGINPAIVNVHISIDNMATGHTALAATAIQQHMDNILAEYGKKTMHNHWRRIFTGYCSLQTASAVFKYELVVQYWLKRKSRMRAAQATLSTTDTQGH